MGQLIGLIIFMLSPIFPPLLSEGFGFFYDRIRARRARLRYAEPGRHAQRPRTDRPLAAPVPAAANPE